VVSCRAGDDQALATLSRLSNLKALDEAARRFKTGLDNGLDEDMLVAMELGAADASELSELQAQYKDKIKEKLLLRVIQLGKEDEEARRKLSENFALGKEAYSCGEYGASVVLLERAVEELGEQTVLGGEAQLWLALAYQACGREKDCIDLYKRIEQEHPVAKIKKQAYELRYIMEAPKLTISEEERVKIPLIQSDTWRKTERKTYAPRNLPTPKKDGKKSSYWDRASWELPPVSFIPDKWYVRVAWAVLLVGVTIYANAKLSG